MVSVVRSRIAMTVGPEFLALLEEVKAAFSTSHPGASLETIFAECMKIALDVRARRRRAKADRPRAPRPTTGPAPGKNRATAAVKRAVWQRDQGRCAFTAPDGRRCASTHAVEFHHRVPRARGGPWTVDNIALFCRAHNDLAARHDFGDGHMDRFTAIGTRPRPRDPADRVRDDSAAAGRPQQR